jgi:hypothetical protein
MQFDLPHQTAAPAAVKLSIWLGIGESHVLMGGGMHKPELGIKLQVLPILFGNAEDLPVIVEFRLAPRAMDELHVG